MVVTVTLVGVGVTVTRAVCVIAGSVILSVVTTVDGAAVFVCMTVETIVVDGTDSSGDSSLPPPLVPDPPSTATTEYLALRTRGSTAATLLGVENGKAVLKQ